MMVSLRTRLLWGIVVGTALLLAVFSAAVYTATRQSMIRHFDKTLLTGAHMLSAVIEEEGIDEDSQNARLNETPDLPDNLKRQIDVEFDVRRTPEFNTLNGGAYYQIWGADGRMMARSPSLGTQNLVRFKSASDAVEYRQTVLPDKTPGRAISYQFWPKQENLPDDTLLADGKLTLVLAQSTAEVDAHLYFLKWLLLICSAGIVILSTGTAFLVTRASLRPIHTLAQNITAVGEDNLAPFFSSDQYPAELAPICRCLNDTLARLEKSFSRERQFNANVAHELRTPLAGMRSTIEVCLSRDRQSAEYRDAFESCLHIVRAMNKMIDTLLSLSKLESGQLSVPKQPVSLRSVIDTIWLRFSDKAYDKGIVFENTVSANAVCLSDSDRFEMIISNVLENAVEYTNLGGRIWLTVESGADAISVLFSNTGCQLTSADVENVFDFFWRKSQSRTDAGVHCGIGLPVARKVAGILGITMTIKVDGDVFTVCLRIPS